MFMKNGGHMIHMRGYLEIVTNFLEIVCSQLKEDTCCVYPSNLYENHKVIFDYLFKSSYMPV